MTIDRLLLEYRKYKPNVADSTVVCWNQDLTPSVKSNSNLRAMMEKIVFRAGVELYPKLFHNLRASRETEYDRAGIKPTEYCRWIGNSPVVATKHYIQRGEVDFQAGIDCFLEKESGLENGSDSFPTNSPTFSPQIPPCTSARENARKTEKTVQSLENTGKMQRKKASCKTMQNALLAAQGLEPRTRGL